MWKSDGKRTVMGLGAYPAVGLAEAREKAAACRKQLAAGINPLTENRKEATPTFRETVDRFLDAQRLASWRNAKHREQWKMTLGDAYCARILDRKVDEIGTAEVLSVLKPIWQSKAETASRLRGRIERVLAFAEAQGWRREGKNPAQWKNGLDAILPQRQKLARGHHRALPYADVPAFMQRLGDAVGIAPRALEFTILTAARSGETVGAAWSEIDLEKKVWTIPRTRMKAGREHRVPLSEPALRIIELMVAVRESDFVFPGQRRGRPISAASMEMLLRRMAVKDVTTIHGFRSAFRDWAGDATSFPREIVEQALAHRVGDATEIAYRRSDALEKRRAVMDAWGAYCSAGVKILPLRRDARHVTKM
jgi:integrase